MRYSTLRGLSLVCLLIWCSAVFGEEDIERLFEMYRQSGADSVERLREYEALLKMRRAKRERHLPAGSQFDFARESYRLRSQGETVACSWTSAGPTNLNGRVISIAIDPNDNQKIYAATVGGLWRSSTAGRRWQRVSDDFLAMRFGAIAVNPGASNEILASVGDPNMGLAGDGLWWSTDFGAPGSWSKVTTVFDNRIVYRIRVDPASPNDVYVAASNGVWRGTHDPGGTGITFTLLGGLDASTHDIAVDFSSMPRKIYAGVRKAKGPWLRGIYKWNGILWIKKDTGIDTSDSEAISIALSESNPLILYAKVAQQSDGSIHGMYRTTTAGEKPGANTNGWDTLPLGEANGGVVDEWGWYNTMLEVDPSNPSRVFHGGTDIWMSTNLGGKWERIHLGKDPDNQLPAHADVHTLAFDPANPKIVYIGNDGGIDRSTDMSQATWHWVDVSHGMVITMFYSLTSNRNYPTLLAGGTQDNGTAITFGNRTWYQPGGGDAYDVGSDAGNPDSLYSREGAANVYELVNPVPGTEKGYDPLLPPGNGPIVAWTGARPTRPPLVTDIVEPHSVLGGRDNGCGKRTIVKTTDGIDWEDTDAELLDGGAAIVLASAPSAQFKTYLAAVAYRKLDPLLPCITPATFNPYVTRTDDGGETWVNVAGLPATREPTSLVFDPYDKNRSYVTYGNFSGDRIYMSTGGQYYQIAGTFPDELPNFVRRVAVDPFDTNVLYAATSVGVFRGVVTPTIPPSATWEEFDEGLPDGLEINDLWVDPQTGLLTIGTFGFGAFRRDIRKDAECKARMLVVRDCVNDDGRQPSPCGGPDPEHPIPDPNGGSSTPDASSAGSAHWFASRDIRVDVPSKNPPANQIEVVDSVEFELCPTAVVKCQQQAMIDSEPVGLQEARVYVQVTNRGVEAVSKTRVIALWAPSSAAFESLPETFWTKTFPPGDGKCGLLDPTTQWQLVDPIEPCRTISTVTPDMPELARFKWNVPFAANGGATIFTVVESQDDLLDASIRKLNKLSPEEIVPGSRHIALRNMRIKGIKIREIEIPKMWPLDLLKLRKR